MKLKYEYLSLLALAIFCLPKITLATSFSTPSFGMSGSLTQGLIGWWTMDGKDVVNGVIRDKSGNGNDGNPINIATSTFYVNGKIGQSTYYNGTSNYLKTTNNISINGNRTISFWLNPNDNGNQNIIKSNNFCAGSFNGFDILRNGNTSIEYSYGYGSNWFAKNYNGFTPTKKWTLVTVVHDESNSNITLYLNGASSSSAVAISGSIANNSPLYFGQNDASCGKPNNFNGYLDDVRIYNRALSAKEVGQLYNLGQNQLNSITASSTNSAILKQGLTGWWTFDGKNMLRNVTDSSGNGRDGKLRFFPATSTVQVRGVQGQALSFVSNTGFIQFTNPMSNFLTKSNATISLWFYAKQGNTANCYTGDVSAFVTDGTALGGYVWLGYDGQSVCGGVFTGFYEPMVASTTVGQWHHVVLMTTNGVLKLFLDGNLLQSRVVGDIQDLTHAIQIGKSYTNKTYKGYLDDIRLYNVALSTSTIMALYNEGKATKENVTTDAPTSSLQSGLVGWWTFDGKDTNWATGQVNDRSENGNVGYMNNMATSTSVAPGKLGQALKFDGFSQYITRTPFSPIIGTSDVTVSAWIKLLNIPTVKAAILQINGNGTGFVVSSITNTNNLEIELGDGSCGFPNAISSSQLSLNKWYHVAFRYVRSGNATMFINGVPEVNQLNISACSGSITSNIMSIAKVGSGYIPGFLDDVRIYNRALSPAEIRKLYNGGM